jgi:hypothetical protein
MMTDMLDTRRRNLNAALAQQEKLRKAGSLAQIEVTSIRIHAKLGNVLLGVDKSLKGIPWLISLAICWAP